ncbi:diacylglycerol/lipid kinase family protein [Flavilitoribacter nigricans]|uniref:DAGKc domain-containing protein n=1 Tax=Flavilitoribacter nigricans (strain ATCC 23147 / DSM 23189 / NBRC 102662 / NCIMB 1420 / SS-2) TaxID=1122177 RepID=A0A2D0NJD2_FLAN2|nr:diacylglycerol kinase family protein [Flavilitoribacter nigricans]PHN08500.1 hypothetical protein CRP01_00890 [Flavilitoribacter nigricans DSM 23189 = NBRC 102662]
MKKCLFIVNPISGGLSKKQFLLELENFCRSEQLEYGVIETANEGNDTRIQSAIKSFQPQVVVACGGDGTVNLVARNLLNTDMEMAIIPLGSANGLAGDLGIPSDNQKALQLLLSGKIRALDVIAINEDEYCLHLSDLGFNATIVENFNRSNLRGQLAYLLFFLKSLFTDHTRNYHFILPDQSFQKKAAMVVLANGSRYGFGAEVNPVGRPDDGHFELCVFSNYPWYAFFSVLFHFLTGQLKSSRYYEVFSTERLFIKADRPVELQVDGEPLGPFDEVNAILLPRRVNTLVPA